MDNVHYLIEVSFPDNIVKRCFHKASDFIDVATLTVKARARITSQRVKKPDVN